MQEHNCNFHKPSFGISVLQYFDYIYLYSIFNNYHFPFRFHFPRFTSACPLEDISPCAAPIYRTIASTLHDKQTVWEDELFCLLHLKSTFINKMFSSSIHLGFRCCVIHPPYVAFSWSIAHALSVGQVRRLRVFWVSFYILTALNKTNKVLLVVWYLWKQDLFICEWTDLLLESNLRAIKRFKKKNLLRSLFYGIVTIWVNFWYSIHPLHRQKQTLIQNFELII